MTERTRRRVHVVDDDRGVRNALAVLLRTAGYTVDTWESGDRLLAACPALDPGVIVLDLRLPGSDGLAVLASLQAMGVVLPVVMLTGHGDVGNAVQAIKAGALDFLEKPVNPTVLFEVVARAHDQLEDSDRRARYAREAMAALAQLTPRERDVLARLARGDTYTEIATALEISPRTVEVHRANLLLRLGVRNLPEALRIAFAARLEVA